MLKSHISPPRRSSIAQTNRPRRASAVAATVFALFVAACSTVDLPTSAQRDSQSRERRVETNANSTETVAEPDGKKKGAPTLYYDALKKALKERGMKLEEVCDLNDAVSRRILADYGAMYVGTSQVLPPTVCIFTTAEAVEEFQEKAGSTEAVLGGVRIELQPAAMTALLAAREEARQSKLDITPRGGAEAARRDYDDTFRLWNTRVQPGLAHWNRMGRLSKEQVAHLRALPIRDQIREILELEKDGIYFSKDFSKSILYSIAAPGTSQHIAMLALDVDQFADERVRKILARHGWFQTVKSDLPHFTYLGLGEAELPSRGLRAVMSGKQLFWIPNVGVD